MRLETLTKEQADTILGWARTDAGQFFQQYLQSQADPATASLLEASNMRDVFRSQGAHAMLERIFHFFTHAQGVSDGSIPAYQEPVATDQDVSDLPAPWGSPLDDGAGVGEA